MSGREQPENPARTTQPDGEAEPGEERVARHGQINEDTSDSSDPDEERFDAG